MMTTCGIAWRGIAMCWSFLSGAAAGCRLPRRCEKCAARCDVVRWQCTLRLLMHVNVLLQQLYAADLLAACWSMLVSYRPLARVHNARTL